MARLIFSFGCFVFVFVLGFGPALHAGAGAVDPILHV
jgi:hypothetical protein